VVALWLESRFLASMQLIAVLLPSLVWLGDFLIRLLTGHFLTRWTHYMFRPDIPLTIRALSLYHGWLPFLLLWLVGRLGYYGRGWLAQTLLTWVVLPVCFFLTDPVRALNGVFGPSGEHRQECVAPGLWLALMMIVYPMCVYLPTHLSCAAFSGEYPRRLCKHSTPRATNLQTTWLPKGSGPATRLVVLATTRLPQQEKVMIQRMVFGLLGALALFGI